MKVYVCWDTRTSHPGLGPHACGLALEAVRDAGYDPDVVRSYGWKALPDIFNATPGRRAVKAKTGSNAVPALELDDGTMIQGSSEIIDWAEANPAPASTAA